MAVKIKRDSLNRIQKLCIVCHQWKAATIDNFPLVNLNYAAHCRECKAKWVERNRKQMVKRRLVMG